MCMCACVFLCVHVHACLCDGAYDVCMHRYLGQRLMPGIFLKFQHPIF